MSDESEELRRVANLPTAPIGGLFDVPPDEPGHVLTSDPALDVGLVE